MNKNFSVKGRDAETSVVAASLISKTFGITKSRVVDTSLGAVVLAERAWNESIDIVVEPDSYMVELQLLPNAVEGYAGFPDQWNFDRLEPVGRAYLLPMSEKVRLKSECRQYAGINCSFSPEAIEKWFDGEFKWTDRRLAQSLNISSPAIRNLLFRMSEEVRLPSLGSDVLTELIFSEILIELARYCLGREERSEKGGLAPWRMQLIKDRLAQTANKVSLSELATLCNLSPRQLTRAFRNSHGCSIGDYIAQDRINHAKRMLRTDQNVKSIVHALGFNSPSHFYVAFHRATGETPQQYRQRVGRGDLQ